MARQIKLNGREQTMMRTIGFGLGVTGHEIQERMNLEADELVDILNSLLSTGFVETASMKDQVNHSNFLSESYEINPSYANDLRDAMKRS
jgi:hypothetical protein